MAIYCLRCLLIKILFLGCYFHSYSQVIDTLCVSDTESGYGVTGDSNSTFVWEADGGTIAGGQGTPNVSIIWDSLPGLYDLSVVEIGKNGCVGDEKTAQVLIINPPDLEVFGETTVCEGDTVTFWAAGGLVYDWDIGISGDTISFIADVNQSALTVSSQTPCGFDEVSQSLDVKEAPDVSISADVDDLGVCPGEPVFMEVTGIFDRVIWSRGLGGSIRVTADEPGPYTVTALLNGCESTAELTLDSCRKVKVYNTFTPDGDGVNDFFEIENIQFYPENRLAIYNRWGNKVFEAFNYKNDWDGTYKGEPLPVASYYYILESEPGVKPQSGYINILRR